MENLAGVKVIKRRGETIEEVAVESDASRHQQVFKGSVVEITMVSKSKTLEGTLVYPER